MMNEQQPYQEQRIPFQQDIYRPAYERSQQANLIQWQLSPQKILQTVKNSLLGRYFDEERRKYIIDEKRQLMNENGVAYIMTALEPIITPNSVLTFLDEEKVAEITITTTGTIVRNIIINRTYYGVQLDDIETVNDIVGNAIYLTLKRSQDKTTLKFLKETERFQMQEIQRPAEKKWNIFGKLGGKI